MLEAIMFCRDMRKAAQGRAEARLADDGPGHAVGSNLEVIRDGLLCCTVARDKDGRFQAHWSLNDDPISRPDAEIYASRHLKFMAG